MASFLFLHESPFEFLGVLSLCGYLEQKGHEVEVLISAEEDKNFWDKVKDFSPDWVGFSSIATLHHECYDLAREAKDKLGVRTVFGGPYVSYNPKCIEREEVDVLICGEGEEALVDLLDAHDRGKDYSNIPNLWTKRNGTVISNPVRQFETNLDKYPIPDRKYYYKYPYLRNAHLKHFITGRDCPYNCYFCFNQKFRELYNLGGYALRRHSTDYVLEELRRCKGSYPLKMLAFDDDVFPINKNWLADFLPRFKKEINLPYSCNIHPSMVNEDIAKLLGKSGCHHVMMGLESGNPRVRKDILGKKFSNERFLKAADLLHQNGVKIMTYNMLGSPTETLDEALETMDLNSRAKIEYPWWSLYQPQPGTRTADIAFEMGCINDDYSMDTLDGSIFHYSVLKQPEIKEIERAHKLFYLGARNRKLIPLIRKIVRYNLGPIYTIVFLVTYFIRHWKESGASFSKMVLMGLKQLKRY